MSNKDKVVSLLTNCFLCNKQTIKSKKSEEIHLCDNCKKLSTLEIYIKLIEILSPQLLDDPIFYLSEEDLKNLLKDE